MKVFLDSSYLFPYIGIDLIEDEKKKWTLQNLIDLTKKNVELMYSDLSLFELYAKVLKLVLKGFEKISLDKVHANLLTLSQSNRFQQIPYLPNLAEHEIIQKLKQIHNDTIDCILVYLAVGTADIFLSMDESLYNHIYNSPSIQKWMKESNPDFRISIHDLLFS